MELIGRDQNTRRSSQNFTYPHFWWSFQIRSPNPKSTHKRLHRNPIFVRYPFCSRNGCYIYNVPTKGFVLYLLIFIYLCSSVSLIIRFLESIGLLKSSRLRVSTRKASCNKLGEGVIALQAKPHHPFITARRISDSKQ